MPLEWWAIPLAVLNAAILMPLAINARVGRDGLHGVQKVHLAPTSRLGGGVIVVAYLIPLVIGDFLDKSCIEYAMPLFLCSLPVVLMGFIEDLTQSIRPRYRMVAALAAAALASWFAGGVIPRLDIPYLDRLMTISWIALPVTWVMVAGVSNAINIVDGAHGLAGGTALLMFAGLATAAALSGDLFVTMQALMLMGAITGFMVWNYPRGRIFMGDAGAYFIGFMYAELSIQLVVSNPSISPWFSAALGAYPIVETLYSMYRRIIRGGRSSMIADALHLHSLVFKAIARRMQESHDARKLTRANAMVAPRLWLHAAFCVVAALVLRENTLALILFCLAYTWFYLFAYGRALASSGVVIPLENPQ